MDSAPAFKAGAKEQEKFFAAVYSGDPKQVLALFDPRLVEEVDEPVIAEWMNAMKETLGEPEGLKASSFNTNKKYEDGVVVTESSGKIRFEKGEAESKLVLHNGKIVEFNVIGDAPTSTRCIWKLRRSSALAVSGDRPGELCVRCGERGGALRVVLGQTV